MLVRIAFAARLLMLAWAVGVTPVRAGSLPVKLTECENAVGCTGDWRFSGREGKAHWTNGVEAVLIIERFDEEQVIIRRKDLSPQTLGATVFYRGRIYGNRLEGDATYSCINRGCRSSLTNSTTTSCSYLANAENDRAGKSFPG